MSPAVSVALVVVLGFVSTPAASVASPTAAARPTDGGRAGAPPESQPRQGSGGPVLGEPSGLAQPPLAGAQLDRLAPGRYRLDVEVFVATEVPVLGEQRTVTRTTSLVVIDDRGMATAIACAVSTTGAAFSSRLPMASIRALPSSRFAFVVDGDRVRADMGEGTLGWRGAGPLPEDSADPRVLDVDGDGNPGMLMELDLGAMGTWPLQVVSRGRTVLDGHRTRDGAEGRLGRVESEERVLSGLPVELPMRAAPVDVGATRFSLVAVDARDCAALPPKALSTKASPAAPRATAAPR